METKNSAAQGYHTWTAIPANTGHSRNAASMLVHRLRRWPNIETTLAEISILAGMAEPGIYHVITHCMWKVHLRPPPPPLSHPTQEISVADIWDACCIFIPFRVQKGIPVTVGHSTRIVISCNCRLFRPSTSLSTCLVHTAHTASHPGWTDDYKMTINSFKNRLDVSVVLPTWPYF